MTEFLVAVLAITTLINVLNTGCLLNRITIAERDIGLLSRDLWKLKHDMDQQEEN